MLIGPASAVEPALINLAGSCSTPVAFLGSELETKVNSMDINVN